MSVCTVAFDRLLMSLCMTHVGSACLYTGYTACFSVPDEFWRFITSTRVWERVNNTGTNGAGPSLKALTSGGGVSSSYNTMTSVGLDLWVVGSTLGAGSGEGDACTTRRASADAELRKRVCLVSPDDSSNCWC